MYFVDQMPLCFHLFATVLDGYLPADLYGDLPFYGTMALLYTVLAGLWVLACVCYWYDDYDYANLSMMINVLTFYSSQMLGMK